MAFNSTPRRRFGVALGVVLTGVAAGLIGFAGTASAHIPDTKAECKGEKTTLSMKLTHYVPNKKANTVKVTDGDKVLLEEDFRDKFERRLEVPGDVDHNFTVVVTAWDDPKFEKGWSVKRTHDVEACVTPTETTTTTESTTTTTESTTTTTESTTETTDTTESTTTTTDSVPSTTTPPAPTTTTPPVVEEDDLAQTGASVGVPLGIGAVLLVGGVVLLFVIRRRGKA